MRKRLWVALLALSLVCSGVYVQSVSAISDTLVVSRIQTKSLAGGSASEELVELFNSSDNGVLVNGWCLEYGQKSLLLADPESSASLWCFEPIDWRDDAVYIPARSSVLLISAAMSTAYPLLGYDGLLGSGMADNDRWLRIVDAADRVIDKVEWSGVGGVVSLSAEGGKTAPAQTTSLLIQRIATPSGYQDTDDNSADFVRALPPTEYEYGSVYESSDVCRNIDGFQASAPLGYSIEGTTCLPPPVDACSNLEGFQTDIPLGYAYDDSGQCLPDMCLNIDELQTTLPFDHEFDSSGNCVLIDVCTNLVDAQLVIPDGYIAALGGVCLLDVLPLELTELLPNIDGDDTGREFIELYNPNDEIVDLSMYVVIIGIDTTKVYAFPPGSTVPAKSYAVFYNSDISFTLNNTSSRVLLQSVDGTIVDTAAIYDDPEEDESWSLFGTTWQYTNQGTPGSANVARVVIEKEVSSPITTLQPCAPNQYRNPDTNRCRLLVSSTSRLAPCKDGQYRSETTNRCRSIATDANTLVPCVTGQERNPLTNRCRTIASSGGLAACKEGQERHPETNRCRNVISDIPLAGFAVEPIADGADAMLGWWALGGVGLIAVGYAGWEWRHEIKKYIRNIGFFSHSGK